MMTTMNKRIKNWDNPKFTSERNTDWNTPKFKEMCVKCDSDDKMVWKFIIPVNEKD